LTEYAIQGDVPSVLVIGAMAIDAKGQPRHALVPGSSVRGTVRLSIGGVARNVAENLARLGVRATLLSVVGDDPMGRFLLDATARAGVNVEHVLTRPGQRSGTYIAVLDRSGVPAHAIDDMAVLRYLTPGKVYPLRRLFREADMIVFDANVPRRTIETIFRLADRYNKPVCVDPTSTALAERIRPHLGQIHMVVPNLQEAQALVCAPGETLEAQELAMRLVGMGVEIAIVTLAEMGLYYATSDERGRVPALQRDIVDLTGAGDALIAAVIFGLLNDIPVSEAVRLGISAAALTLQCPETVCPDLSLDRLYGELVT
jgi:pseudouridine kinase